MTEKYSCIEDLISGTLDIIFGITGDPEYIEEFLTERALNQIAGQLGYSTWILLKNKMSSYDG